MAARLDLVRIRAIAVHAVVDSWEPRSIARSISEASRLARRLAEMIEERLDQPPWTLRVLLPPSPLPAGDAVEALREAIELAGGLDNGVLYSLLHVDAAAAEPGDIEAALGLGDNVYVSVHTPVATEAAASLLYEASRLGPAAATRFALTVPGPVETAYLPAGASLSPTTGVSAALLYPRLLEGRSIYAGFDDLADAAAAVEEALVSSAEKLGIEYRGIDLSLSPWMDESAARIVEQHSGVRIHEIGAAAAVREIEELIEETCSDIQCTGFNQVMLPIAEDNVLKQRVHEGLTLQKILYLTGFCVAGPDMAVIPAADWTREKAKNLIADMAAASQVKQRPLGARIIAVEKRPGETVDLGRFGETPVARIE